MCGIFGFTGLEPDPVLLRLIILEASRRGPHAWGVTWVNGSGALERHVELRPLWDAVDEVVERVGGASMLLGHARLATTAWGGRNDPEQVQPLLEAGVALAHNGTIADADDVRLTHGLPAGRTGNDSEVLLQLLAARDGDRRERMAKALLEVGGGLRPQAAVAIDLRDGMLAASTGQPLYRLHRSEGTYLCSRQLPGALRVDRWAA